MLLGWLAVPLVSPFVLLCCEPFPHLCSRFFLLRWLFGWGQVTGFVGAERLGWEMLIERMGAELCKSLKKRGTTHLVCKEVR